MTKKDKIQYFKLVEPKLRQKFIEGGFKELADSDYQSVNISGRDIQLFKEKYEDFWISELYRIKLFEDKEFNDLLDSQNDASTYVSDDLNFPDDKHFYQFGIPNLDIKEFKSLLGLQFREIYINKLSGGCLSRKALFLDHENTGINIQDYIKIEVDYPQNLLDLLEAGKVEEVLAYRKKSPTLWEVPQTHPLSRALTHFDLDDFIEVLVHRQQWIVCSNDEIIRNFLSFDDFTTLKSTEQYLQREENRWRSEKRFFFKIDDPVKMRAALIEGSLEILSEIKNITFSSIFSLNKNEG